jgi:beta-phosphoglucomutase
MLEAVIFDMDGVLIDSVPTAQRVRTRLLSQYGVEFGNLTDPHNEQHKGSSLKDLLKVVRAIHPNIEIDERKFADDQTDGVLKDLEDIGTKADPQLLKLLDELKDHLVPLAVATAGLSVSVDNKLRILGIKDYFKVIITANDVTEHKPNPASYLLAIERLGVKAENCIIFEDSTPGVDAGVAAGGKVIGFTKYSDSNSQLPKTIKTISSWGEVNYEILVDITSSTS